MAQLTLQWEGPPDTREGYPAGQPHSHTMGLPLGKCTKLDRQQATQSRKVPVQVSHAWLHSYTHGPTRLKKSKPAKAARKCIRAPGSQGAQ